MNSVQYLQYETDIGNMPTNRRGSFRLRFGNETSELIHWPPEPSPAQLMPPIIDNALHQLPSIGYGGVQVSVGLAGHRVEFVNSLGDQAVPTLEVVDQAVEQTFNWGESWEPLLLSIYVEQQGGP